MRRRDLVLLPCRHAATCAVCCGVGGVASVEPAASSNGGGGGKSRRNKRDSGKVGAAGESGAGADDEHRANFRAVCAECRVEANDFFRINV
jgi:hypothetical protein